MEVQSTSVSSRPAPTAEAPKAPQNEPKKPQDNSAAMQAPGETKQAVQNSFGDVPKNGNPKQPDDGQKTPGDQPKLPVTAPKEGGTSPDMPKASNLVGPGDAKIPAWSAQLPADPKSPVADPKAAPGEPGSPVTGGDGAAVKTPDGKTVVLDQNKNPVPVNADGTAYADPKGNPYAVHFTGKYRQTVDNKTVVYANALNGKAVALNEDGSFVDDYGNGNPKVVNPNGHYVKTVDAKEMVYPIHSGGKMAALNGTELSKGPQDKVFLVNPDGNYAISSDGKYMAYGTGPEDKFVAIANDGRLFTDNKGHAYTLTADGNYMQPEPGRFGVLNAYNKAVASDAATGEIIKESNGHAYVLDDSGSYMQPEAGKFAVYNEQIGKTVATDGNGNAVVDTNGNPYLVGNDGQYAKTADGKFAVYTPKIAVKDLSPVTDANQAQAKTSEGLSLYQDQSGQYVGVTNGGLVVQIDQAAGKMAADPVTGAPVVLNNPFDERPLPPENMSVVDTLDKLPVGTEHRDPMAIKNELFKDGVLDKESLYAALGKYNPVDVYDALINSSKYGGWNNAPKPANNVKPVRPTEEQAKAMIAAMIAWQNDNGSYKPIKEGEVPIVGLVSTNSPTFRASGFEDDGNVYINVSNETNNDAYNLMQVAYHELNHANSPDAMKLALFAAKENMEDGVSDEVVTEYLANKWSNNKGDAAYDIFPGMKIMDNVVSELGGGDINAGTDMLKRAYLMGDPVAIQLFLAAIRKVKGT